MILVVIVVTLNAAQRYGGVIREKEADTRAFATSVDHYLREAQAATAFLADVAHRGSFSETATSYLRRSEVFERTLHLDSKGRVSHAVPTTGEILDYSRLIQFTRAGPRDSAQQPPEDWTDPPVSDRSASRKDMQITAPYRAPEARHLTVGLVAPIRDGSFLVNELSLRALQGFLTDFVTDDGNTLTVIVDEYGNLLGHPDWERVKRQENLGHIEPVRNALNGAEGFLGIAADDGRTYLWSSEHTEFARWSVLSAHPVRSELLPIGVVLAVLLGAILAGFTTAGWLLSRTLDANVAYPLARLTEGLAEIEHGKQFRPKYAPRFRELEELYRQFESMTAAIFEREQMLQDSLNEKQALLREIHHRVKNNYASIISLIRIHQYNEQAMQLEPHTVLRDLANRIHAMALVHQMLYRSPRLDRVQFDEYLRELMSYTTQSIDCRGIQLHFSAEGVTLSMDQAVPCGLIANELVTNACKHAFPGRDPGAPAGCAGSIAVTMKREGHSFMLSVADDGIGMPELEPGASLEDAENSSVGFPLVRMLAESQLGGELTVENQGGTRVVLRFPADLDT